MASFRAGAYSVDQFPSFRHRSAICAAEQCSFDGSQIQYTYRLLFADRMTNLRRALVTIVVSTRGYSDLPLAYITQFGGGFKTESTAARFPDDLVRRVETMLTAEDIPSYNIDLRLDITDDVRGRFIENPDADSRMFSSISQGPDAEQTILQDAADMNIRTFAVSTVYVYGRDGSYCYYAEVGSRHFTLQALPFSASADSSERQKFFEDIRRRCLLQDCPLLSPFGGLVVNDHTGRIESYLYETPACANIRVLLESAIEQGMKIPCEILQMWIGQLVGVISKLHSLGVVIGFLTLADFYLDHNGDMLLSSITTAERSLEDEFGNLPPELRDRGRLDNYANANFRTDIFQLGLLIWQIAEHLPRITNYAYCTRNACSSRPCYECSAEHTNPVALPPCLDMEMRGGPNGHVSIDVCIAHCRQVDPRLRLPAHQLQQLLPQRPRPIQLETWLPRFRHHRLGPPWCNECGLPLSRYCYHCAICDYNDFDLCESCVATGVHCFVPEHRLIHDEVKKRFPS
jgi:hypothetical protein